MKILQVLTYYRPWTSGLTIYVERLSKALARQGHDVTVLTAQYEPDLPRYDVVDGVKVVRIPVAARVSKGVLMPSFGPMAWKLARRADVIQIHLPQFDAPGVALRGQILGKPVVLTYHCDLNLPQGAFNRFVDRVVLSMNQGAGLFADAVVTYTRDYGENSPFLSQFIDTKLKVIPPPVELADCSDEEAAIFRQKHKLDGQKVIGICTRLATEKGVEILLRALPMVLEKFPNARVLHAGQYQNVLGEEAYAARLAPLFEKYKAEYTLLGNLHGVELTAFYKNLDCLTIPSLNSTESFGLVQIEAMKHGVPVVSSNLPGVRQPVTLTGMGEVVAIGNHEALAGALIRVLGDKQAYQRDSSLIEASFLPDQTASEYLKLFEGLRNGRSTPTTQEPPAYDRLRAMRDGWR
ncbi:MAG: glycosyltransferase family 4 protein [Chloroflexota bacterium]